MSYFMCMFSNAQCVKLVISKSEMHVFVKLSLSGSAGGCCMLLPVLPFHSRVQGQDPRFWKRNLVRGPVLIIIIIAF